MPNTDPIPLRTILAEVFRQMDPSACLQRASDAIATADLAEARLALSDYRAWRARGGFEPIGGDRRADEVEQILFTGGSRLAAADSTEAIRRAKLAEINKAPGSRDALEARYGRVWDTSELAGEFDVLGFLAPFVVVRRKSDGAKGSLEFQHAPRFYFNFHKN
jgi:hypothetical protein